MRADLVQKTNPARRAFLKQGCASMAGMALDRSVLIARESVGIPDLDRLRLERRRSGMISPGQTYRAMEWEFHTPAQQTFDINVEAAITASRDAGAESLMFYAQDHWGYAFYPSDSAVRHPSLKFDLFGTECALARKAGVSATCYYSLQFNNQCAIAHPDWAWTNENGTEQRFFGRWHVMCLDSPYRQYVLAMMGEVFSRYEVGELFLDIFGIQFVMYNRNGISPFCFCKHTEEAWLRDFPNDPYREGFKTREGWTRRYEWHQRRSMTDMLDEVIRIARKFRPNLLISLNGGPESFPDEIMQRVSFVYAEPLDCPTGIALGSILMRGWGRPGYQAGVFTEYGYSDTYPAGLARVQADALIVQNARTFFVGNAGVLSGLDGQGFSNRWFSVAKEAWADVRNVDCLLGKDLEPLLSTAVLYSNLTRREFEADKRPYDFRNSQLGALELMTHSGRPVESLTDAHLQPDVLNRFELLVLPEVLAMSDEQATMIRNWVSKGGTLISSYRCGLLDERDHTRRNFALADVLGVDYLVTDTTYAYDNAGKQRDGNAITTYLESHGHPLTQAISSGTVGLPGPFIRLRETTAQAVMSYRLPLLAEDASKNLWVGWGSPPPGPETAGTAVAFNKFGKGQSLYFGVPIFWALKWRARWIEKLVPAMVRRLVPDPVAEIHTQPESEYVHGSFFRDRARGLILVQILDAVELATSGEARPTPDVDISLDAARCRVRAAELVWPNSKRVEVLREGSRQTLRLRNPGRYTALYLRPG
jgi:hypothetical protein